MNEVMWAILSEWDRINTEIKAFVSGGLFVTSWEAFMSCDSVKGGKRVFEIRWVWAKDDEWWA